MMSVEQSMEWELAGETEVPGKKRAPVTLCPPELGSNPGRRGGIPATNRLSCGTALVT
jgi:hypothetical protein